MRTNELQNSNLHHCYFCLGFFDLVFFFFVAGRVCYWHFFSWEWCGTGLFVHALHWLSSLRMLLQLGQYLDLNRGNGTDFIHTALSPCAQHAILAGSRLLEMPSQYKTLPLEVPTDSTPMLVHCALCHQCSEVSGVVFHFESLSSFFS